MKRRPEFRKILIANRGEIAVRVIRACRELGIATVGVYSDADREALHVLWADEAYPIGPAPAAQSYLAIEKIVQVAKVSGAEAVHPGYGFLAENPDFAAACRAAGLVFIGPSPGVIRTLGDKTAARRAAIACGVPVVPGTPDPVASEEEAIQRGREIGFPLMIKAAMGGGGKGMRLVRSEVEIPSALRGARSEAGSAFGDPSVYLERYIERPRHIEIQVLADTFGSMIHLGERECSIQRRHQKVIEESPSSFVDQELRRRMGEAACRVAASVGYHSTGTVEFLVDEGGNFYFLEMNTRLQVEHPVTELVTGIDLVRAQIAIAAGEKLPWNQDEITWQGWAIECRIYAEDPFNNFLPSPGVIKSLRVPGGPWVRDDSGVYSGYEVTVHYDPMISKLIVWGRNREEAVDRMARALGEYKVSGIQTTIPFHQRVMAHPDFRLGAIHTHFIDSTFARDEAATPLRHEKVALLAVGVAAYRAVQQSSQSPNGSAPAGPGPWALSTRPGLHRRR